MILKDLVPILLKRKTFVIPAVIGILILLFVFLSSDDSGSIAMTAVKKGQFSVSIIVSGELRAKRSFTLTTPRVRYGQMQIVYLMPEGTSVKTGDVIVQFATTDVDKTISDRDNDLNILQSDFATLKANQNQRMADLELNLKNIDLAYQQSLLQVEKTKFEADVDRKAAEINVEKNRLSVEQARMRIETQKIIDKSDTQKAKLRIHQVETDLLRARTDRELYTLRAPFAGLAVYEMNGSTNRKIAVGDSPYPGMPLVSLPDLTQIQSLTNVNEVDISKVVAGQKSHIRLDAFPDRVFDATVSTVGTIGQQKDRATAIKTFEVVLDLERADPILRPGMTTSNEIVMERIDDVLSIPLESVFEKEGKIVAYVVKGSAYKAQEIQLGVKNSNFIIVKSGLQTGDKVALRNPESKESSPAAPAKEQSKKNGKR